MASEAGSAVAGGAVILAGLLCFRLRCWACGRGGGAEVAAKSCIARLAQRLQQVSEATSKGRKYGNKVFWARMRLSLACGCSS